MRPRVRLLSHNPQPPVNPRARKTPQPEPSAKNLGGVARIIAGYGFSLALKNDGTVKVFDYGEPGDDATDGSGQLGSK